MLIYPNVLHRAQMMLVELIGVAVQQFLLVFIGFMYVWMCIASLVVEDDNV